MLTSLLMSPGRCAMSTDDIMLWVVLGVLAAAALIWLAVRARANVTESEQADAVIEEPYVPPTPRVFSSSAVQQQTDDALIAVITAAVAAAVSEEQGSAPCGFRVVSFRRVGR